MLQPVGGMDQIPYAFARRLGKVIQYRSVVKEIRKMATGVRIVYTQNGMEKAIIADYCIAALQVSVMDTIRNDFSGPVKKAIKDTHYFDSYKIAWESKRFWETESSIYGGISWLFDGPIRMVLYPSGSLTSEYGVLLGGYGMQSIPAFNQLSGVEAKLAASRTAVERLHRGHGKDLRSPVYVAWDKIPFSEGAWITGAADYYESPYKTFLEPDDLIYFAGDFCSHLLTWQEGAVLSAQRTVNMISERVRKAKA